ncbi:MAG: MFS transporter [Hyphomonas sp.]|uniref:MFS transporter n=1 Tax=Hyphomonas sp. TaxID=87 RepID=UPI0017A5CBD5|nr:MFS transporter [Hyphomonas sp.]MBA3069270.1 MFS transporter [Hyphomonas sp.]MBU4061782.1 MFS transporter [Alphaproteobacteria bacterium]MBU4163386.1 MFS transporter [Alphaproteobacteria bacterium]
MTEAGPIATLPAEPRLPKAAPDGLVAATLLAFLATAGLFYVNIMAAIVDGLVSGLGLSEAQAGQVGSINIYGAAAGALVSVFLVRRIPWKILATACLVILIGIDIGSIAIQTFDLLLPVRAAHGFAGGILTGSAFAVIARTANPDRTFGMLLFVQFGLGGLGVMVLPPLAPLYGTQALFLSLALFSAVTLLMLPFLSSYPPQDVKTEKPAAVRWTPFLLTLGAIFVFQAANMGLLAYIIRLGLSYGLDRAYVSTTLGLATWIALLGPLLVMVFGLKFGRFPLLLWSMVLTLAGTAVFHFSGNLLAYLIANCGTGITWGFVMPYLFGMTAEFDKAGRAAAFGGFVSKLGLASGPMIAGWILAGNGGFPLLINLALIALAISALIMLVPARLLDGTRVPTPIAQLA